MHTTWTQVPGEDQISLALGLVTSSNLKQKSAQASQPAIPHAVDSRERTWPSCML